MTREIAHQKSFERALYAIEPNFPPGKLPGDPAFTDKYFKLSRAKAKSKGRGTRATRGSASRTRKTPWRSTGGDGGASVKLSARDKKTEAAMKERLESDPTSNPLTGADLGAGPGAGTVMDVASKAAEDFLNYAIKRGRWRRAGGRGTFAFGKTRQQNGRHGDTHRRRPSAIKVERLETRSRC